MGPSSCIAKHCYPLANCTSRNWLLLSCSHISRLYLLSKSLISKNLLFLENFLCEANLELKNCLLVNNAIFRPTVIEEELLIINFDGLPSFDIAHEAAVEVRMYICFLNVLKCFSLFSVSNLILPVSVPYGCNP